jgi:hypothetical protein
MFLKNGEHAEEKMERNGLETVDYGTRSMAN